MPSIADFMHTYNVRAFENLDAPVMNVPIVEGAPGSQSLAYAATFVTICGETGPSAVVSITNGPDTLNGFDKVKLGVVAVPAGARYVRFYKNTVDGLRLLAQVTAAVAQCYDTGQALGTDAPTSENTSGRPRHLALGFHPGEHGQRQEWMDMQAAFARWLKGLGDTIFRDGDVREGCQPQLITWPSYRMTEGYVYLYGMFHYVPAGTVELDGSGSEIVGLSVVERWITPDEDNVLRAAADEGTPAEYAAHGADRLVLEFTWVVDEPGQVNIREFLDGEPLLQVIKTERTELQDYVGGEIQDLAGDHTVKPFPMRMQAHATDTAKLLLEISGGGRAQVGKAKIETKAPQFPEIPKGRDVKAVNNSVIDPFSIPGGSVLGSASENFDVDGLSVKLKVGSGNSHTVPLTGNGKTAVEVAAQISGSVNAYPTSGVLVYCTGVDGHVRIQAVDGKDLVVQAVASDAYTELGISAATYPVQGQRIYQANNEFIKAVSDLSYLTVIVEAVVHDGSDHIDPLGHENVSDILGASYTAADCHDEKWDFVKNVDFVRNGNSIDFAALGGADPSNGETIYVKYIYNVNAVKGTRVRVRVTDAQVVKGAAGGQDVLVFTGGTAVEVISGNPVSGLSGNAKDVIRILRVNNASGQSQTEYNAYSLLKNSGALLHEDSQLDWSGAGAQGVTPGGQPVTAATYYVTFEYWRHTVEGDFVTADSYLNDYDEIEMSPSAVYNLRDCVDFRTLAGVWPKPDEAPRFDYEYFLSRIDKVALGQDGYFVRIPGVPADVPVPPKDQTGTMSVALLYVPPYTYTPGAVTIQSLEMQRITQRGLNELRAQLDRHSYYLAQLQAQQAATENTAATDAKMIFVDTVAGQKYGDYGFNVNGVQFTAAVDPTERCIRLPVSEDGRVITLDEVNSSGVTKVGSVLMFDYQPSVFLAQLKATSVINVNPNELFGWIGTLTLDPAADFWTDTLQLPDLDVNYDEQLNALAEMEADNAERARKITWGAWALTWDESKGWAARTMQESLGQGHWSLTQNATANAARERSGTYKSIVPERTLVELGDRVVDVTVLPMMRQIQIAATVDGMMPNTDCGLSIDGVAVNFTPTGTSEAGILTYQGKSTVQTGAAGALTGVFTVPEGIKVGQKSVKVCSANDPNESFALSLFTSQGFLETHQESFMGIISTTERDEVVTETQFHYGDPLAETFAVESGVHWISGARIRFQSKDAVLPVTVELRKTSNGYPTRTTLATATLYPANVNISDDASLYTEFTFPNVVGLGPGEYSGHLITNCTSYRVWYARMGEVDVVTGELVRQNPTGGVMFTSPNDSYWEGHAEWDLTFELMEANFENNCQLVWSDLTGIEANMLCLGVTQFLPEGVNLHWMYSVDGGSEWIPFLPGINTELGQIATAIKLRCDVTGTGGTFQILADGAGIILLLNDPSAWYVGQRAQFDDDATKITMVCNIASDGVNGTGARTVTPYYTIDEGLNLVELRPPNNYSPIAVGDGTYREWEFETRGEKTITGASNTTPIVIDSAGHERQAGEVIDIAGIEGNTAANGTWRVANRTDDTFELVDPTTGADSVGNGAYTTGGTINLTAFTQCRFLLKLETSNQAVTPKVLWPIMGYCS